MPPAGSAPGFVERFALKLYDPKSRLDQLIGFSRRRAVELFSATIRTPVPKRRARDEQFEARRQLDRDAADYSSFN